MNEAPAVLVAAQYLGHHPFEHGLTAFGGAHVIAHRADYDGYVSIDADVEFAASTARKPRLRSMCASRAGLSWVSPVE